MHAIIHCHTFVRIFRLIRFFIRSILQVVSTSSSTGARLQGFGTQVACPAHILSWHRCTAQARLAGQIDWSHGNWWNSKKCMDFVKFHVVSCESTLNDWIHGRGCPQEWTSVRRCSHEWLRLPFARTLIFLAFHGKHYSYNYMLWEIMGSSWNNWFWDGWRNQRRFFGLAISWPRHKIVRKFMRCALVRKWA